MEKERKIRILSIGALLVAIIGLTVAFAAMSRTLIINGTATIDSAKWDIHFANPLLKSKKGDAREVSAPVISEDGGELTLKVGLRKPQDEIVYNVDVVNDGDIDAEITQIDYPELSEEQAKIIEFEAVYDDGSSIALKQSLPHESSKTVRITIRFKDVTDESLLASEAYDIPLTFKIHYTQSGVSSDGSEVTPDGGEDVVIGENTRYNISFKDLTNVDWDPLFGTTVIDRPDGYSDVLALEAEDGTIWTIIHRYYGGGDGRTIEVYNDGDLYSENFVAYYCTNWNYFTDGDDLDTPIEPPTFSNVKILNEEEILEKTGTAIGEDFKLMTEAQKEAIFNITSAN